jgi:hypothetical protein
MTILDNQKELTLGESKYMLVAFPAMTGLTILNEVMKVIGSTDGSEFKPEFIRIVIMKGSQLNTIAWTEKRFDDHFKKKYKEMYQLFQEILDFNFDLKAESTEVAEDPNE